MSGASGGDSSPKHDIHSALHFQTPYSGDKISIFRVKLGEMSIEITRSKKTRGNIMLYEIPYFPKHGNHGRSGKVKKG